MPIEPGVSISVEPDVPCPHCGQAIKAAAKICKHCRECVTLQQGQIVNDPPKTISTPPLGDIASAPQSSTLSASTAVATTSQHQGRHLATARRLVQRILRSRIPLGASVMVFLFVGVGLGYGVFGPYPMQELMGGPPATLAALRKCQGGYAATFGGGLIERSGRLLTAPWVELAHRLGSGYRRTSPWDFQLERDGFASVEYMICAPLGRERCEERSVPCKVRKEAGSARCLYTNDELNEPIPLTDAVAAKEPANVH